MMLVDSNIVIYAFGPDHPELRRFVDEHDPAVSAVSVVESLGYHRLGSDEKAGLEDYFAGSVILPVGPAVIDRAVSLRQQRRMKLGDALIGATALVYGLALVTHNTADFAWVPGLTVIDPLTP